MIKRRKTEETTSIILTTPSSPSIESKSLSSTNTNAFSSFWISASFSFFLIPAQILLFVLFLLPNSTTTTTATTSNNNNRILNFLITNRFPLFNGCFFGTGCGFVVSGILFFVVQLFQMMVPHHQKQQQEEEEYFAVSSSFSFLFLMFASFCFIGIGIYLICKGIAGWQQIVNDNNNSMTTTTENENDDVGVEEGVVNDEKSFATPDQNNSDCAIAMIGSMLILVVGFTLGLWCVVRVFQISY